MAHGSLLVRNFILFHTKHKIKIKSKTHQEKSARLLECHGNQRASNFFFASPFTSPFTSPLTSPLTSSYLTLCFTKLQKANQLFLNTHLNTNTHTLSVHQSFIELIYSITEPFALHFFIVPVDSF